MALQDTFPEGHAFGWKSQPAMTRLQEALSEIRQVGRVEPVLTAEGAIALLERVSPALENVDSSSGAIGGSVNRTIAELVPVIAAAPADVRTRAAWLDRLFEAHAADQIPYIERLAEYWGELCGSTELASDWADRLIGITRLALSPDKLTRGYFHGTSACLSALFTAGRYDELIELVRSDVLWSYKRWAVKALAAQGREREALAYAERCRSPWASDTDIDRLCEQILLASGQPDAANASYAISANRAATYLGWHRAVAKKYPDKAASVVLADLVRHTPGNEGKWVCRREGCEVVRRGGRSRQRDAVRSENADSRGPGLRQKRISPLPLKPGSELFVGSSGFGYEITVVDVRASYLHTLKAADNAGVCGAIGPRILALFDEPAARSGFVASIIGKEVGL